jgi:phage shock protein C
MVEEGWLRKLSKSQNDKWIGGVCGGLGQYTPLPSWLWRVVFCCIFLFFGTGLIIYILLWIFMPKEPAPEQTHE